MITGALVLGELIAGILRHHPALFFLTDGDRLWHWLLAQCPARRRDDLNEIGQRAYSTLGGYLRGVSTVARIDALLIGAAVAAIGVPLVLPLMALTFLGAFIPLVGAIIAGCLAALIALVATDPSPPCSSSSPSPSSNSSTATSST